jgi:1D-myo-inositol 3-kinase
MISLKSKIKNIDFLCLGHITHDRYGDKTIPGGCAYFGAKTGAALGAKTSLITKVGEDFSKENQLSNIEVLKKSHGKTTVFTNLYPEGKMRVQLVESQADSINVDDIPDSWKKRDVVFIAPVMGEMNKDIPWGDYVEADFISLGLQGFMKKGSSGNKQRLVVKIDEPLNDILFTKINAVFLSEEDINLFGTSELLKRLTKKVKYVFITQGENGCDIYYNNQKFHVGIYKTSTLDPTGAGDTFASATTLALASGLTPVEAAKFGSCAASIIVEEYGSENLSAIHHTFERYDNWDC